MEVTAEMVKELREQTGARMMDCKTALRQFNGDFKAATAMLKQLNLATGDKAASKPATEGLLGYGCSGGAITVVEMSASTDFATQNPDYKNALALAVKTAHDNSFDSVDKLNAMIGDQIKELAGKIGENIAIRQVVRMEGNFGYYIHHNNKEGALVELEGATGEIAGNIGKDIAMHIVFAKPTGLSRADVPNDAVLDEMAIIKNRLDNDPKNSKKPQQIIDKIIAGQLDKFYAKTVLPDQPYYRDDKKSVSKVLAELGGVSVKRFVRFHVGVL